MHNFFNKQTPKHPQLKILSFLSLTDIAKSSSVSKHLLDLCKDDGLWKSKLKQLTNYENEKMSAKEICIEIAKLQGKSGNVLLSDIYTKKEEAALEDVKLILQTPSLNQALRNYYNSFLTDRSKNIIVNVSGDSKILDTLQEFTDLCLKVKREESKEFLEFVIILYQKIKKTFPISEKAYIKVRPLVNAIELLQTELQNNFIDTKDLKL